MAFVFGRARSRRLSPLLCNMTGRAALWFAVLASAILAQDRPAGWKVRARLALDLNPHQIVFGKQGRVAWIALTGSDRVVAVDTTTFAVTRTLPCAGAPLGLALLQDGSLWVSRFRGGGLVLLDSGSTVKRTIGTGVGSSTLVGPLPSGHHLVSVEGTNRLLEVDLAAGRLVRSFPTGKRPFPPGVTSDGRLAFVPCLDDGTLTIVDLLNGRVVKSLRVGTRPTGATVLPGDVTCAVVLRGENRLALVNTASKSVVDHLDGVVGRSPFSAVARPTGDLLFVNDTAEAQVSVVDLQERKRVARLKVGTQPILMTAGPRRETLWVSCEGSHELWVLEIPEDLRPRRGGTPPPGGTEVAVMGMIHGRHRKSRAWSLARVAASIRAYAPDVVLTEIPPDRWERIARDYRDRGVFEDPRIKPFPEYTDCLLALQKELGFEIEPCAAWTSEMAGLRRARMKQFQTEDSWAARRAEYERRTQAARGEEALGDSEDPLVIHSPAYDAAIKAELRPYDEFLNEFLGPGGWTNINRAHMKLVRKAIRGHPGQRVLIMFGAGHKYWFLEDLARMPGVRLQDLRPYIKKAIASTVAQDQEAPSMRERCKREVVELHRFFQDWFAGTLPDTDAAFARLEKALASDFEIVGPDGRRTARAPLLLQLRAARGKPGAAGGLQITVKDVAVRPLGEGLWLVTYEEWQERDGKQRGRRSSAVLQESGKAPNGFLWRHVHETWL